MKKSKLLFPYLGIFIFTILFGGCSISSEVEKRYYTKREAEPISRIASSILIGKKPKRLPDNIDELEADFFDKSFVKLFNMPVENFKGSREEEFRTFKKTYQFMSEQIKANNPDVNTLKMSRGKLITADINTLKYNQDSRRLLEGLKVDGHHIIKKEGKYGLMDENGLIVIPLEYDLIDVPSEGKVSAKKNGKWGYLNLEGEIVIPFHFDEAQIFIDGYAHAISNGIEGVIDSEGNWVSDPQKNDNWMSKFIFNSTWSTSTDWSNSNKMFYLWYLKNSLKDEYYALFTGYSKKCSTPFRKVRCYYIIYDSIVIDEKGRFVNIIDEDFNIQNDLNGYILATSESNYTYIAPPQAKGFSVNGIYGRVHKDYIVLYGPDYKNLYDIKSNMKPWQSHDLQFVFDECYWAKPLTNYQCYNYDGKEIIEADKLIYYAFPKFLIYTKGNLKGISGDQFYTEALYDDIKIYDKHLFFKKGNKWAAYSVNLDKYSDFEYERVRELSDKTFKLYLETTGYHILKDSLLITSDVNSNNLNKTGQI
ncbi:WG repeat-containing protein [Flammeovirga aprica]|uniref:WG repeat-containing protein n=1 Tax=Flammeovirga aprica JL-4 TaxID=694437 RepID=A0A7X9S0Z7_9BACT|nr:WG repeat-containing protein [Flammeovirga aprica]NME72368.1 WG repeat-containing protein [Flammeovirga aprica JL-4]